MKAHALLLTLTLSALTLCGCIHRIELSTAPAGASITVGKRQLAAGQKVVKIGWFQSTKVSVRLAGHRPLDFRLRPEAGAWGFLADAITPWHWPRSFGLVRHSYYEIRLIPEHGGAGTWTPEDAE